MKSIDRKPAPQQACVRVLLRIKKIDDVPIADVLSIYLARPKPAHNRPELNLVISENAGGGERLDLLCGHFAIAPPHDRLLCSYLPPRFV